MSSHMVPSTHDEDVLLPPKPPSSISGDSGRQMRTDWMRETCAFLTQRGLREHYMLKHEISAKQAHEKVKATFDLSLHEPDHFENFSFSGVDVFPYWRPGASFAECFPLPSSSDVYNAKSNQSGHHLEEQQQAEFRNSKSVLSTNNLEDLYLHHPDMDKLQNSIDKRLSVWAPNLYQSDSIQSCNNSDDVERDGDTKQTHSMEVVPTPPIRERLLEMTAIFQAKQASITPFDRWSDSSPDCTVSGSESDILDDDSELDSTDLEFDSIFQPLLPRALHNLRKGYAIFRNRPSGSQCGGASSLPGGASPTTCPNSSGKNGIGKRKRRESSIDGDDGEGDEPSRDRRKTDPQETPSRVTRLLACPFYKFDTRRHAHCIKYRLKGINNIKQHLRRKHPRPIHCPACYTLFTDEGTRDQHVRERSCAPAELREIEGVSDEQWRRLEKRASMKNSLEENWYLTYEILFPQSERPKSPYLDTTMCEHIEFIRDFIDAEGGTLAREIVRSFVTTEGSPRENQVEEWGRRLLEHFLRITVEEMSSRDEPLSGPSLGSQSSAANRQLPTPSSAGRSSPVAPHSAMSSQIQTTAAESLNLPSNGSHPHASSSLPSSIHQETVPEVSDSWEYSWSQDPAFQSINFEGTDMHASFSEVIPDVDYSLYYSLFPNDTGLVGIK